MAGLLVLGCGADRATPLPSASASTPPPSAGDPRLGIGEPLVVIVAGHFPDRAAAEAYAAAFRFGDMEGFYVDEARHYQAIGRYSVENQRLRYLGPPDAFVVWPAGGWVALTAFRTRAGAEAFLELVRVAEVEVQAWQVVKRGGGYVGLGQEPHPDGSGPLEERLPDQERYQR